MAITESKVIEKLATSLGRKDEAPNQELAAKIAKDNDKRSVSELVKNLANKNYGIRSDCIKVLYEIGERNPKLISDYAKDFVALLGDKNNRMIWGAMTALDSIALETSDPVFSSLGKIIEIADTGSVITRDHAVGILIKLSSNKKYQKKTFPLLIEQLKKCSSNQLPMYAEKAVSIVNEDNKAVFLKTLSSRLGSIDKESKRKRIEKVIKKLSG